MAACGFTRRCREINWMQWIATGFSFCPPKPSVTCGTRRETQQQSVLVFLFPFVSLMFYVFFLLRFFFAGCRSGEGRLRWPLLGSSGGGSVGGGFRSVDGAAARGADLWGVASAVGGRR